MRRQLGWVLALIGSWGMQAFEPMALPEAARVEMSDWLASAAARIGALAAAEALAAELN